MRACVLLTGDCFVAAQLGKEDTCLALYRPVNCRRWLSLAAAQRMERTAAGDLRR
jgi:hypothetical protein